MQVFNEHVHVESKKEYFNCPIDRESKNNSKNHIHLGGLPIIAPLFIALIKHVTKQHVMIHCMNHYKTFYNSKHKKNNFYYVTYMYMCTMIHTCTCVL